MPDLPSIRMQRGAVLSQASTLVSDKSADTIQARSVFPHHAGAPDFFKRIKHPPLIRWSGLYLITLLSGAVSLYGQPASRVLDPTNALTQFIHESWQTDDGLPQSTVSSIVQTKEGYIWFGTQEGLVRFDGIEFTVFDDGNEPEFRSNNIRALLVDRNGALWIGTNDAGLVKYREGRFQAVSGDSLFAQARVSALVESENGHLWIGTSDDGLFRLQQGILHRENRVPSQEINSLVEDESGVLWIGTRDRGLIAYDGKEVTVYARKEGLPDDDIDVLARGRNGALWIGTRTGGLVLREGGTFRTFNLKHGLPALEIDALYEDAAGVLWIGMVQGGLSRLIREENGAGAGGRFPRINTLSADEGLTRSNVKSLFQDREGNLWIGTDGGGLGRLREGKFTVYSKDEGIIDEFVYAVHEGRDGSIWFSSEKGVTRMKDGVFIHYTEQHGLSRNFVISLASTDDGSVWMGTYGGGLSRLKDGVFTNYTHLNGLPEDGVFALYTDSGGDLWIGTGGGAARFSNERFYTYTTEDGLTSNEVTVFLEDRAGAMWIGTYNGGLNRLQDGEIVSFTAEDNLSHDGILSLYEDDEGSLWIGTYGGGLNRVRDGKVTVYSTQSGLFNDKIFHIAEDASGNLWMTCNKGLFRVSKEELAAFADGRIARITSLSYGTSEGLKSNEFNGGFQPAGWKSQDGRLWFPTVVGLAVIDPEHIQVDAPPSIVIQRVVVDDVEHPAADSLQIGPGQDRIDLYYAGISLAAPQKIHYQYRLIGYEKAWVDADARRGVFYTNLKPGAYTFQVRARNRDGIWTPDAAEVTFTLLPYYYQTTWFYVVVVLGLAALVFGGHRWRVAKLKAHELELERTVVMRTRDLEQRTGELLRSLEENKEILGITSHDLKNPLGGIIGITEILLEDLDVLSNMPAIKEGLDNVRLVKREAERMLRIVKELLDKHRTGEQKPLRKDCVDFRELVQGAVQLNRQKAEQKNIEIELTATGNMTVMVDSDAILRVADNLISNAVKYSPSGSTVWVTIDRTSEQAVLEVQDQGPGLSEDDKMRVFGKMQRLSARPTGGEHSTGLGLFIVKQIVDAHEGVVGVKSAQGEGAVFWVRLPLWKIESDRKRKLIA